MKKFLSVAITVAVSLYISSLPSFADFKQHYDLGQSYLSNYRYSSAINEFKSALRINYMDNSARIGLINSYLSRAAEYGNRDKDYSKAADDFRSALFYMRYYPNENASRNNASEISQAERNLDVCLNAINFDKSAQNRFDYAKKLRAEGNFSAAAYEFNQALAGKELQKSSFEQVGDIMKLLGNEPKAAEFYKKAVSVGPSDLNLRMSYAKILDNLKSDEDALKEYSYVMEHVSSEDKDILYTLEKIFRTKLESTPNNANLIANMGAVLQKQNRLDEALAYYKQAEAIDKSNINTRINVGTLYQQKGDYRTAIKAYESVLIANPNNLNANLYRAQCYDKLGDTKTAQDAYKKVLALDPDNSFVKSQMFDTAKKNMTVTQFVNYVKTNMADANPSAILYDYALDLHKKGNLDDSIYVYREAIKSNSSNPEMYVNLALAQAQKSDYDDALSTLKIASSKFPQDETVKKTSKNIAGMKTDNLLTKAADFYNNKNYKEAIDAYLSVNPPTVDTMLGAASSYQQLGDRANAIEYYKKAFVMKPMDSSIAYYIAVLYGESEDYTNAKDYLKKSLALNKNNNQAAQYLASIEEADRANLLNDAIALYEGNKIDESLVKFNEVLAADANNSYALYYRGMIYDSKEKRNEAIKDLQKAYKLNSELLICNYLIASDYDALGKYKDAYNYYSEYANSAAADDEYKQYAKARAEELKEYAK